MKKRMFLVLFLVGLMLMTSMASAYTGNALVEEGAPQVGVLNDPAFHPHRSRHTV